MDEGAKRRLVGAAVLVALIVIFVPMLVEQPNHDGLGEPIVIPDEPEVENVGPANGDDAASDASPTAAATESITVDEDFTPPLPVPEPPPGVVSRSVPAASEAPPAQANVPAQDAGTMPLLPEPPPPEVPSEVPAVAPPETSPEPPLAAEPNPVPAGTSSWVVQVASLGSADAAKGLQDELRGAGYTAFVEQATVDGKRYYRVRVGPEVERARAERLATELEGVTGNKPLVQRYP